MTDVKLRRVDFGVNCQAIGGTIWNHRTNSIDRPLKTLGTSKPSVVVEVCFGRDVDDIRYGGGLEGILNEVTGTGLLLYSTYLAIDSRFETAITMLKS